MAQPSARTTMKWVPHPSRAFREGWAGDAVGSQTHRQHRSPPLQKTQGWGTHIPLWERKNKAWRAGPPAHPREFENGKVGHPPFGVFDLFHRATFTVQSTAMLRIFPSSPVTMAPLESTIIPSCVKLRTTRWQTFPPHLPSVNFLGNSDSSTENCSSELSGWNRTFHCCPVKLQGGGRKY